MKSSYGKNIEFGFQIGIDTAIGFTQETIDCVLTDEYQNAFESLQIIDKEGKQRSLIRNRHQEAIWHWHLENREKERPSWGICLKPRQTGISTEIMGIYTLDIVWRPNRFAYTASFEDESAIHLFNMAHFYYENMPKSLRKGKRLKTNRRQQLVFAKPHYSRFTSATARRPDLASSQTIHNLHLSEIAKWNMSTAKDTYLSIMQCVPDSTWDTFVFIESTARGVNIFKNMWDKAVAGKNEFHPFFFSWVGFPEYFFFFDDKDKPKMLPEIKQLQKDCGCVDEQAYWAQRVYENKCQSDMDLFLQEYPYTPAVAFRYSGKKWFDGPSLEKLKTHVMPPYWKGRLHWGDTDQPMVMFEEHRLGALEVWEKPQIGGRYVISADVGAGIGGNFTVLNVLKLPDKIMDSPEQVAKVKSNRIGSFEAADWLFKLGCWYNWAFVGVEVNNMGIDTANKLYRGRLCPKWDEGYPAMYFHVRVDKNTQEKTKTIGWLTTTRTKKPMYQHFQETVRQQDIIIRSNDTILEMEGLSYDEEDNKWEMLFKNELTDDYNDDECDSMAIGLQMVIHRPDTADFEDAWG